jgi:ribosome assembly protein 4
MVEAVKEPAAKRQKRGTKETGLTNLNYNQQTLQEIENEAHFGGVNVIIQFKNDEGEEVGCQVQVDNFTDKKDLNKMLQQLMDVESDHTGLQQYQFYLGEMEVRGTIQQCLDKQKELFNTEQVLPLTFKPEAMFKIKPVTRASSTLEGHSEAILQCSFSPDGSKLASASGDCTVRLWDLNTESPEHTCEGHKGWVLFVAFSPDGQTLASGGMDNNILIWDAKTGE